MKTAAAETLHDANGVRVTSTSITAGGATYAVRNISSVELRAVKMPARSDAVGMLILTGGAVVCIGALVRQFSSWLWTAGETAVNVTLAILGAAAAAYGLYRARPRRGPDRYVVYITTNAGQAEVMGFTEIEPATAVRDAIQRAM